MLPEMGLSGRSHSLFFLLVSVRGRGLARVHQNTDALPDGYPAALLGSDRQLRPYRSTRQGNRPRITENGGAHIMSALSFSASWENHSLLTCCSGYPKIRVSE